MMADVAAAQSNAKNKLRNHDCPCDGDHPHIFPLAPRKAKGKHEQDRDNDERRLKLARSRGSAGIGVDGWIKVWAGRHVDRHRDRQQKHESKDPGASGGHRHNGRAIPFADKRNREHKKQRDHCQRKENARVSAPVEKQLAAGVAREP